MLVYSRSNGFPIGEFDISPFANLRFANLFGANLSLANLSGADLSWVNLSDANLSGADLSDTNLFHADLHGANLEGANLEGANLSRTILTRANLSGANLSDANLRGANLSGANLSLANLSGANLSLANLRGANLEGANLPEFQISQDEELIVFKKLRDDRIAKLRIPAEAKRTASLVGKKCRAERAIVVEIYYSHDSSTKYQTGNSLHYSDFIYEVGKEVKPTEEYDGDIRGECRPGIHFFMTEEEAKNYVYL